MEATVESYWESFLVTLSDGRQILFDNEDEAHAFAEECRKGNI